LISTLVIQRDRNMKSFLKFVLIATMPFLMSPAIAAESSPLLLDRQDITNLIIAIDATQRKDAASFVVDRLPDPQHEKLLESPPSSCRQPIQNSRVMGTASIGDLDFAYELKAPERALFIITEDEEIYIDLNEFEPDAALQVTLLPCATPIGALICIGGGAGYCAWNVQRCRNEKNNCPCGVLQVACGVCGEGPGVTCAPCNPFPPFPGPTPPWPWPPSPPQPLPPISPF